MITSAQNRQIKELNALISKRKERDKTGLFTAEGVKLFLEAPRQLIKNVFVSASFEKIGITTSEDLQPILHFGLIEL